MELTIKFRPEFTHYDEYFKALGKIKDLMNEIGELKKILDENPLKVNYFQEKSKILA